MSELRLVQEALADAICEAAEALERPYDPTRASNLSSEYRQNLIGRLTTWAAMLRATDAE